MAGKKVKSEVEGLRGDIQSLAEAVWALRDQVTVQSVAAAAAQRPGNGAPTIAADHGGELGSVVSRGAVQVAGSDQEIRWDVDLSLETALAVDNAAAAQVLAAIGHRQRLAIVKTLLLAPTTAAELVSALDLGTTGAAYHHLNVLQGSGLVTQTGRGVFTIEPAQISSVVTILTGIAGAPAAVVVDGDSANAEESPKKRKRNKSE